MNPIMFSISTLLIFQTKHFCWKTTKLFVSTRKPMWYDLGERPPNPESFQGDVQIQAKKLYDWFQGKQNVLCITGAGISTDSKIPDYRGHNGSYYKNHNPVLHHDFLQKEQTRKRYWARSMVGWKEFADAEPNDGHLALAVLERLRKIGVTLDDCETFYKEDDNHSDDFLQYEYEYEYDYEYDYAFTSGSKRISIITQNVDRLHSKAGNKFVLELHGRNDILKCQSCLSQYCRHEYHEKLQELNGKFLQTIHVTKNVSSSSSSSTTTTTNATTNTTNGITTSELRPDGDAELLTLEESFHDDFQVLNCTKCNKNHQDGILKPDVVFFGDSVPRHRVNECYAAVNACDGLFVIGSSLAVHSAYRFVNHANVNDIPIAILNMGTTRAETSGIHVTKIDSPIGPTLMELVRLFSKEASIIDK